MDALHARHEPDIGNHVPGCIADYYYPAGDKIGRVRNGLMEDGFQPGAMRCGKLEIGSWWSSCEPPATSYEPVI